MQKRFFLAEAFLGKTNSKLKLKSVTFIFFNMLMPSIFDRTSMIPKYMSLEEANQIMETGRCMNFLHNICHQRPAPTPAQVMLSELEKNKCEYTLRVSICVRILGLHF